LQFRCRGSRRESAVAQLFSLGSMTTTPTFTIQIPGRGEEIVYREAGRIFSFDISCAQHPLILYAGSYWDGIYPVTKKQLTDSEREFIIPRLVAYLGCKGEPVEVRDE